MTEEDKELIGRYMNWEIDQGVWRLAPNGDIDTADFDLNDAGLCVQEMQKRGDWKEFLDFAYIEWEKNWEEADSWEAHVAWLFNSENFFNAMSQWLKERGK